MGARTRLRDFQFTPQVRNRLLEARALCLAVNACLLILCVRSRLSVVQITAQICNHLLLTCAGSFLLELLLLILRDYPRLSVIQITAQICDHLLLTCAGPFRLKPRLFYLRPHPRLCILQIAAQTGNHLLLARVCSFSLQTRTLDLPAGGFTFELQAIGQSAQFIARLDSFGKLTRRPDDLSPQRLHLRRILDARGFKISNLLFGIDELCRRRRYGAQSGQLGLQVGEFGLTSRQRCFQSRNLVSRTDINGRRVDDYILSFDRDNEAKQKSGHANEDDGESYGME